MEQGADFIRVSQLTGVHELNDLWKRFGEFYPEYKKNGDLSFKLPIGFV